jgi:hypothetical protein
MPDFPILGPLQAAYFAMKNKSRSSAAQKWAKQHGLDFAPNSKTFTAPANPMMGQHASEFAEHSSRATGIFARLLGMSKMQQSFPQFSANRFRGDWQSDKNICWGTWKGYTVITWDTVFYDLQTQSDDWSEGEYSSILILTDIPLHGTLVAPNSLTKRLSSFGIEEGRGTFSMETIKFELDAFNKAYRVRGVDPKWTTAIIDQAMIEWLMQQKKHTIEVAPGGIMVSTWFTLKPEQTAEQLDFCTSFLDRIPEDLKHHALDGSPA